MNAALATRRRKRAEAGYTLVEVMTALGILMIGSAGIFAMQQGAIIANAEARRLATAQHVAATVAERLRRDALSWTEGGPLMTGTSLDRTSYLTNAGTTPGPTPTAWMRLTPAATSGDSWGFDYWGNDTTVAADMAFCAQMRFQWVLPAHAVRADVRVYYPRRGDGTTESASDASAWVGCPDTGALSETLLDDLRFVHLTTILRWTPGPLP